MNIKLVVAFIKKLTIEGTVKTDFLLSSKSWTAGEAFDFLNLLVEKNMVAFGEGEIKLIAPSEQLLKYKKDIISPEAQFEVEQLNVLSKKMNESQFKVLKYIHENISVTRDELCDKFSTHSKTLIDFVLNANTRMGIIFCKAGEYYSRLSNEDFQTLFKFLKEEGTIVELEVDEEGFIECLINYPGPLGIGGKIKKDATPIAAMLSLYNDCKDIGVKSKMRLMGIHFLTYPSILNLKESHVYLLNEKKNIEFDFYVPIDEQLRKHNVTIENGKIITFEIKIALNPAT